MTRRRRSSPSLAALVAARRAAACPRTTSPQAIAAARTSRRTCSTRTRARAPRCPSRRARRRSPCTSSSRRTTRRGSSPVDARGRPTPPTPGDRLAALLAPPTAEEEAERASLTSIPADTMLLEQPSWTRTTSELVIDLSSDAVHDRGRGAGQGLRPDRVDGHRAGRRRLPPSASSSTASDRRARRRRRRAGRRRVAGGLRRPRAGAGLTGLLEEDLRHVVELGVDELELAHGLGQRHPHDRARPAGPPSCPTRRRARRRWRPRRTGWPAPGRTRSACRRAARGRAWSPGSRSRCGPRSARPGACRCRRGARGRRRRPRPTAAPSCPPWAWRPRR